jgi:glucans biosynthesis protein
VPIRPLFSALLLTAACLSAVPTHADLIRLEIDHAFVANAARKLAAASYQASRHTAPRYFRELDYDTYRQIVFDPAKTMWSDEKLPYRLQFFHPGYLYTRMVQINEFTDTHAQTIPFSRNFFQYRGLDIPLVSRWGLDFAGFKVLHPLNAPERWDELVAFLGASYFRALGRRHVYGVSARGLAINAGGPATEEFPAFIGFWIGKPAPAATSITVHALLDGPSVSGAYTFVITPGAETVVDTRATLFFRRAVELPGLVPLSSMFWFGEGTANHFGDFRPEVHDSDGLLVAPDAKTRLWRPLLNPPGLTRTDIEAPAFAGFGLLQRDRSPANYEDFEATYERRPSVWIEPVGTWPAGRVRLVELPARDEYHDNVTVFWLPRDPFPVGQPVELAWKQRWTSAPTFGGPPGWVSATRQTVHDGAPDRTRFVVDFDAASLASLPANAEITIDVGVSSGAKVASAQLVRREGEVARRLLLVLQAAPGGAPVDVRARLLNGTEPVTETWTTRWQP